MLIYLSGLEMKGDAGMRWRGGGGGWHGEWGSPIGTGRTPDTGVLERPPLGFPAPDIASMAATDLPEVLVAVYACALLLSRAIPRAI